MAYYWKIVSRQSHDNALAVVVEFWANQADHDNSLRRILVNDFFLDVYTERSPRVVRDGRGFYKDIFGGFHDPDDLPDPEPEWEREAVAVNDVTDQVVPHIDKYARLAERDQYTGDHTRRPGVRGAFLIAGQVIEPEGTRVDPITPNNRDNRSVKDRPELIAITNVGRQPDP